MFAWLRNLGRVDYQQPPAETSAAALSVAAALAGVDIRLSELAGIPRDMRTEAHEDEIDALLAQRQGLRRPSVPVVPGRST